MYKRKTYVINKELQYGLIATFLIIVVCSLLLFSAGFVVYYMVTGMLGEYAYDEFIEITQRVKIRIQPLKDADFAKPRELAEKLKTAADPISKYIRENLSVKDLMEIDHAGPTADEFEVRQTLRGAFNLFLRNAIRHAQPFYDEARFRGVTLSPALKDSVGRVLNPQSAEIHALHLKLLEAAYPEEIKVAAGKSADLADLEFQRVIPGMKRYELVLPPVIINNLLLMLIIIVVGIFYSHRIAGPIYRLEQDIGRVLSGERRVQVKLRQKDKLKPLAEQVNRLINELENLRGK